MNKERARRLLPLVNNRETMADIDDYIQYRIELLRDYLEQGSNEQHRGAISELRRFKNLRNEVLKNAE